MGLIKMKAVINYYSNHTWFIVAFEKEFTSNNYNILYLEDAGKVNAAMATQWLIDNFNPTTIINVGTAGGNPNKVEKNKIYEIGKVIDRDWKTPNTIYPEIIISNKEDLKSCYTGDSFVTEWNDKFDIVDMEAYAIAKVCKQEENNVQFKCYKYISDTGSDKEWYESLDKCNKAFNEMFEG